MFNRWRSILKRLSWQWLQRGVSSVPSTPREQIQHVIAQARKLNEKQNPRLEQYLTRFELQASKTSQFTPGDIWRVMYVCSRMERPCESVLRHALECIDDKVLKRATAKELSLFLHCLGVFHKKHWLSAEHTTRDRVLDQILNEIAVPSRRMFEPVDVSQVAYALAMMNITDTSLAQSLTQRHVLPVVDSIRGRECANLLWSLNKLENADKYLMHQLSKQAIKQWTSMRGREKSMTMWTWGCLGEPFKPYVRDALSLTFSDKSTPVSLMPQHYSSILLTLARLKLRGQRDLLENLMKRLIKTMQKGECGEQSLANITWALGQLKYQNASHVATLAQAVTRPSMLEQLSAQGVCNVLMGWAMTGMDEMELIEIMAEEVVAPTRLPAFHLQELAMLNWSFGKLKLTKLSLIDRLVMATSQTHKLKQYDEKQLCAILSGWALMGLRDQEAIQKVLREALCESRLGEYKTFEVANLIWATGSLQVQYDNFYSALCDELRRRRRIVALQAADVKNALLGFYKGGYDKVSVAYFFRDVFEHWLPTGKLHKAHEPDLKIIHAALKRLQYIEPILIHHIEKELERRRIVEKLV